MCSSDLTGLKILIDYDNGEIRGICIKHIMLCVTRSTLKKSVLKVCLKG